MNAIAKIDDAQARDQAPAPIRLAPVGIFSSPERFEFMQRAARVFAESDLVPPHMKGKLSNCLIALNIADRLQEDPLTVIQNIAVVNGRPGWMTSYMIARANRYGIFRGRISWRIAGAGKDLTVTAFATLADTAEEVFAAASMAMAEAEGWTKNPKYRSMPELMLRYRSAAMLIRLYCPEVMLGFPTVEEVETPDAQDVAPHRPAAIAARPPAPPDDDETGEIVAPQPPKPPPATAKKPPAPPPSVEDAPPRQPERNTAGDRRPDTPSDDAPAARRFPGADATVDDLVAWVTASIADATAATLQDIWQERVDPHWNDVPPMDRDDLLAVYRRRERELDQ